MRQLRVKYATAFAFILLITLLCAVYGLGVYFYDSQTGLNLAIVIALGAVPVLVRLLESFAPIDRKPDDED